MTDWFITLSKNDRCIPARPSTRLACNPIPYLGDDYIATGGLTSYYVPNTDIVIIITNRSLTL